MIRVRYRSWGGGTAIVPDEGAMPLRNKNSAVAACALLALTMSLTGCENVPWNPDRWGADRIDVLSTEGRTGSMPMNYDTLMRLRAPGRARGGAPHTPTPFPHP